MCRERPPRKMQRRRVHLKFRRTGCGRFELAKMVPLSLDWGMGYGNKEGRTIAEEAFSLYGLAVVVEMIFVPISHRCQCDVT